ncbi:MAG: hypothetical protein Q9190_004099 [Brigantiaea leucoxantha]
MVDGFGDRRARSDFSFRSTNIAKMTKLINPSPPRAPPMIAPFLFVEGAGVLGTLASVGKAPRDGMSAGDGMEVLETKESDGLERLEVINKVSRLIVGETKKVCVVATRSQAR